MEAKVSQSLSAKACQALRKGLGGSSPPSLLSSAQGWSPCSGTAPPEVSPVLCPSPVPPRLGVKAEDEAQVLLSFISFHPGGTLSFCLLAHGHAQAQRSVPQDLSGPCCCSIRTGKTREHKAKLCQGCRQPQSSPARCSHPAAPRAPGQEPAPCPPANRAGQCRALPATSPPSTACLGMQRPAL